MKWNWTVIVPLVTLVPLVSFGSETTAIEQNKERSAPTEVAEGSAQNANSRETQTVTETTAVAGKSNAWRRLSETHPCEWLSTAEVSALAGRPMTSTADGEMTWRWLATISPAHASLDGLRSECRWSPSTDASRNDYGLFVIFHDISGMVEYLESSTAADPSHKDVANEISMVGGTLVEARSWPSTRLLAESFVVQDSPIGSLLAPQFDHETPHSAVSSNVQGRDLDDQLSVQYLDAVALKFGL